MNWRFLKFERYDPFFKTGLNDALSESVRETGIPVVFLAGWSKKTVNVGRSQSIEERVSLGKCEDDDITVVRRQGGGGTTFLTPEGEITWGLVAPDEYFPDDVNQIYREKCGLIADAVEKLGIDARHEPVNDVVTENGKISGSTIRRKDGVTYFGGTLLYKSNPKEMFRYIKPGDDKKKGKHIENFKERVSSVSKESEASFEESQEALRSKLLEGKNWEISELTEGEIGRARSLGNKYRGREWLYRE
ncbi:lipoate--protein ligase family protein [Candidatus Nanohalococcus occultus]|uniref:Lipoate-protein ligase A n=1 Tax=Candidatus Nanohalococcus occultus TaxID=2978047 RepID=A0ABY8CJ88_9ARCH|nr:Lipoate-protein ligase A [Candidatus Nanohaloarchaeota archaeon SVXNc]